MPNVFLLLQDQKLIPTYRAVLSGLRVLKWSTDKLFCCDGEFPEIEKELFEKGLEFHQASQGNISLSVRKNMTPTELSMLDLFLGQELRLRKKKSGKGNSKALQAPRVLPYLKDKEPPPSPVDRALEINRVAALEVFNRFEKDFSRVRESMTQMLKSDQFGRDIVPFALLHESSLILLRAAEKAIGYQQLRAALDDERKQKRTEAAKKANRTRKKKK